MHNSKDFGRIWVISCYVAKFRKGCIKKIVRTLIVVEVNKLKNRPRHHPETLDLINRELLPKRARYSPLAGVDRV